MKKDGMTGRTLFDKEGNRADFYMDIVKINNTDSKKIAELNPYGHEMKVTLMRSSEEVTLQVAQSLQNKTVIVASILSEPFLMVK